MAKEEPSLLNVQKAAAFLGVNPSTIRHWALSKKLNGVKIGSRGDWRFTKEDLQKMLINNEASPPSTKTVSFNKQPLLGVYDFLAGGEMGERIRSKDWSSTPFGPVEKWPQSLQTIVRIMLTSRQPIWIGWGPDLIKLYNVPI